MVPSEGKAALGQVVAPEGAGDAPESKGAAAASDLEAAPRKSGRRPTAKSVRTVKAGRARWGVGFALALMAGLLFGWTFDMPILLMECAKEVERHPHETLAAAGVVCNLSVQDDFSKNPFNYVFSHFCGIVVTSFATLVAYVVVRRERAYMPRKIVVPSVLSGVMWGIAQAAWFEANKRLSVVVAFPIISTLPGVVALFVGFVFFGELRSCRSRTFALLGLLVRIPGVALIALSSGVV